MTKRKASASWLWRAFLDAGFTPSEMEAVCRGERKGQLRALRAQMFPKEIGTVYDPASGILVQKVEEIFTFGALEGIGEEGFGAIHPRLMNKFIENEIVCVGDLVALDERAARRMLGRPSSKTYRAAQAVLAIYGLYIGMELPEHS